MGGVTIVRSRRFDTNPYPSTKSAIHMSIIESTGLRSDGRILCYGRELLKRLASLGRDQAA